MYIDKLQVTVAEWVALRSIIYIFESELGYEGGGMRRDLWRRQTAYWKQLSATLEDILAAARAQRWGFIRSSEGRGVREVAESNAGSNGPRYFEVDTGESWVGK